MKKILEPELIKYKKKIKKVNTFHLQKYNYYFFNL